LRRTRIDSPIAGKKGRFVDPEPPSVRFHSGRSELNKRTFRNGASHSRRIDVQPSPLLDMLQSFAIMIFEASVDVLPALVVSWTVASQ
jgi:hypothetical protein